MKWGKKHPKGTRQPCLFSTLGENERHDYPWLGSVWYEPGMEEERAQFIKEWREETARMLDANPNLKIVD